MWQRLDTGDPNRLVYRRSRSAPVAVGCIVGGLLYFAAPVYLVLLPAHRQEPGLLHEFLGVLCCWGTVLGLFSIIGGLNGLIDRFTMIDKLQTQVTTSWRWLFLKKKATHALLAFESVAWSHRPERSGERWKSIYPITLYGPDDSRVQVLTAQSIEDARRLTTEIATFLEIPGEHWDETPLESSSRECRPPLVRFASVLLDSRMRRVSGLSANRLRFRQGFFKILKFFGLFFLPIGLVLFLIRLIHGSRVGDDPVAGLALATMFSVAGLLFLLGRRGITFDKSEQCVIFWWGLLFPMFRQCYELAPFRAVAVNTQVKEINEQAVIRMSVMLTGDEELTIYDHRSAEEAESMAQDIAKFLAWDLHRPQAD